MKFYLAYGSNLNVEQMHFRCPTAVIVGTGEIEGYQLLFKGSKTGSYLTIEPKKGGIVPVAVWSITEKDEKRLDRYEGYPQFYQKRTMRVRVKLWESEEHRDIEAIVYQMDKKCRLGVPSDDYMHTCLEGYRYFGFDPEYLNEAVLKSDKPLSTSSDAGDGESNCS